MKRFWFKCPKCKSVSIISQQQVRGDSPVNCACGLIKKGVISPQIELRGTMSPETTFSFVENPEQAVVERRKVGRPKKRDFEGEFLAQVEGLAALGLDLSEIAGFLNIRPETVSRYRKRFKDFDQAILRGTAKASAKVSQALFKNATEKNNYFAQQFWLRNRSPKQWKEKIHEDVRVTDVKVKPPGAAEGVEGLPDAEEE